MGLDFINADAHWSYSGFNAFRAKVAKTVGIELYEMEGFGGTGDWGDFGTPLKDFLHHSDCDGKLDFNQCTDIAPALREVVESFPEDDWDRLQGLLLVEGMENCAKEQLDLEFC